MLRTPGCWLELKLGLGIDREGPCELTAVDVDDGAGPDDDADAECAETGARPIEGIEPIVCKPAPPVGLLPEWAIDGAWWDGAGKETRRGDHGSFRAIGAELLG